MKRRLSNGILFLTVMMLGACSQNEVLFPLTPSLPADASKIMYSKLKGMEGIYKLSSGGTSLGSEFVCKVSRNKVSFLSNANGTSLILDAGFNATDSSLHFAGYWRYAETPKQDVVFFEIKKDEGARNILVNSSPTGTILNGNYQDGQNKTDLVISYNRDYSPYVKNFIATRGEFVILGHHGIQTNANPPFLENSLNAMIHCADYGANAIEIDIRLTKDNVPILIHDPDLNLRVLLKDGILGKVNQFNYNTIYDYVRLRDGQRIPTLQAALDAAIDSTDLKYIWLDIKGDPNVFEFLEPVVRGAVNRSKALGRDLTIMTGLPSDDVIAELAKQPSYNDLPKLCELEMDKVVNLGCQFWGPRFTEGTQTADVARAHSLGIKAFTWTLNSDVFVEDFLRDGDFDGCISDYPAFVVYRFYTHP